MKDCPGTGGSVFGSTTQPSRHCKKQDPTTCCRASKGTVRNGRALKLQGKHGHSWIMSPCPGTVHFISGTGTFRASILWRTHQAGVDFFFVTPLLERGLELIWLLRKSVSRMRIELRSSETQVIHHYSILPTFDDLHELLKYSFCHFLNEVSKLNFIWYIPAGARTPGITTKGNLCFMAKLFLNIFICSELIKSPALHLTSEPGVLSPLVLLFNQLLYFLKDL